MSLNTKYIKAEKIQIQRINNIPSENFFKLLNYAIQKSSLCYLTFQNLLFPPNSPIEIREKEEKKKPVQLQKTEFSIRKRYLHFQKGTESPK